MTKLPAPASTAPANNPIGIHRPLAPTATEDPPNDESVTAVGLVSRHSDASVTWLFVR